ncbi:DUF7266 family protein [Halolamina salifodinae]|uniref:Uncharacterized protein n=1 Tax=Halolamina salifodinae TaxID=1202767 RepID=A0A8T4GUE6_9EURY|nr:hypothetical protein [Halolamina salifodinae]MBP1986731.1 hypothetical protein [Halolamina salifodinae]
MTDDPPAPEPGASLADDDRGVSTTLGYTLTLSITAVLVAGLLTAGGTLIEGQQRTVAADELSVSGQQLAAGFEDADRLAATTDNGTVRVNVWLPEGVAGGGYTLTIRNESTAAGQPARATIVANADGINVTRNVSFWIENPAANRTVPGGPVTIRYNDTDGDHTRELVVHEQQRIVPNPADPAAFPHNEIVYVDATTDELKSIAPDNTVTSYGVDAAAIGPKQADLDNDGLREVPYVTSANKLRLVDEEGETRTLASDAATASLQNSFTSLITIGEWRGETSVFFMNTSDIGGNDEATIYRVGVDGSPEKVTVGGNEVEANAIAGIGDINNDSDADLVYLGTSQRIRYIDDNTTVDTDQGVDADVAEGVGAPRTFAIGQVDRVPFVSSQNVRLLRYTNGSGTVEDLTDGGAEKTHVSGIDWTGNESLEVIYVDSESGTLQYVRLDKSTGTIDGPDGTAIEVNESVGVA